MTDMHQAIFAEENATLDHFWEQLFVDMGTDEWGDPSPNTPEGLKGRFDWLHVTAKKIKHSYEILISILWEETYKKGWLKNGEVLDLVSDRISRNNWTETFDEDTEPEDDKTTEAVKELICASYLSGNASTWAWLHLRFPQKLGKGGNTFLVDAITQLDLDFVRKKEWLMLLKMRKQLGIKSS